MDVTLPVFKIMAAKLFDEGGLTMGQAARLLGMSLDAFIDLCDRLGIPVLHESARSVTAQIDTFERWLEAVRETNAS